MIIFFKKLYLSEKGLNKCANNQFQGLIKTNSCRKGENISLTSLFDGWIVIKSSKPSDMHKGKDFLDTTHSENINLTPYYNIIIIFKIKK